MISARVSERRRGSLRAAPGQLSQIPAAPTGTE
jgi:hypothetical protein